MTWVNAIVQGILIGGLYALFATGLSLAFGVAVSALLAAKGAPRSGARVRILALREAPLDQA